MEEKKRIEYLVQSDLGLGSDLDVQGRIVLINGIIVIFFSQWDSLAQAFFFDCSILSINRVYKRG